MYLCLKPERCCLALRMRAALSRRQGDGLLFVTHEKLEHSWKQRNHIMARSECDVINFSALERELQGAVESERRHERENDAKLRAISQRGSSYSQFRDLVLTCHLKPLEKKDKDGAPRKQPWNPVAPSNEPRT
ncbi:coiled-coil domain-containing protein 103 isoform X1 [Pungitius pungitius]|uniref:coiled-coil domain-containing protein 103 isoform X1 n=2 Tax=Pungitius pungitius TaxID=134920 RepID=UPI002E13B05C